MVMSGDPLKLAVDNQRRRVSVRALLRPYRKPLLIALLGVIGSGIASWLDPWPLKIV